MLLFGRGLGDFRVDKAFAGFLGIDSEPSQGGSMALSFATDIRPLFRDGDIECMKPGGVDLDDPAWMCVPVNAQSVYSSVSGGSMPPDEPWPADRVSLFKRWMDAGCPA
jgi:hypothetical protein